MRYVVSRWMCARAQAEALADRLAAGGAPPRAAPREAGWPVFAPRSPRCEVGSVARRPRWRTELSARSSNGIAGHGSSLGGANAGNSDPVRAVDSSVGSY